MFSEAGSDSCVFCDGGKSLRAEVQPADESRGKRPPKDCGPRLTQKRKRNLSLATYIRRHGLIHRSPPVGRQWLAFPIDTPGLPHMQDTHQISFSDVSSLTIRLSFGDRPVLAPEYAVKAPLDVMAEPDSYTWLMSQLAVLQTEGIDFLGGGNYQCILVQGSDGGVWNLRNSW